MNDLPAWVSWAQALGVPALTAVIAVVGVWIAWRQERTSAARLRHELYDRRFRVYGAAKALLVSVQAEGRVTRGAFQAFAERVSDAEFLVGEDAVAYLTELRKQAIDNIRVTERLGAGGVAEEVHRRLADEESESIGWFLAQFDVLRGKFMPFMQLGDNHKA